jgi:hypothetical protein
MPRYFQNTQENKQINKHKYAYMQIIIILLIVEEYSVMVCKYYEYKFVNPSPVKFV